MEKKQYITSSIVADEITPDTSRNHAVSVEMHVLITLRFLASGSFLQVVGDTFLGFLKINCQPSCESCLTSIDCITFPSTGAERDEIKQDLFQVGGFPCATECIDGTYTRRAAPHENEPYFVKVSLKSNFCT